jgi:hypothetical protein
MCPLDTSSMRAQRANCLDCALESVNAAEVLASVPLVGSCLKRANHRAEQSAGLGVNLRCKWYYVRVLCTTPRS